VTTNSVITFGNPDGTYWDYPMTPSISLYSMDWVVYPSWRTDEHLIISASAGGFQVNISARPIWMQGAVEPTNINIVAAINTDGTIAISYFLNGPDYLDYPNIRTGVRLTSGEVVSFEEYGITRVEEPPVLEPEPIEPEPEVIEPEPEPQEPSPEPEVSEPEIIDPTPEPEMPLPEPEPTPVEPETETPVEVSPEPQPSPESPVRPVEPTKPPVEESLQPEAPEPPVAPVEPEISPELPVQPEPEVTPEPQAPPSTIGGAISEALNSAIEGVTAAIEAFQTAGLDMTEEERKTAQSVVIPSVMVALVATTSMIRK
jgi:hypothetical protein